MLYYRGTGHSGVDGVPFFLFHAGCFVSSVSRCIPLRPVSNGAASRYLLYPAICGAGLPAGCVTGLRPAMCGTVYDGGG